MPDPQPATTDDIRRVEERIGELAEAITVLVRVEERQNTDRVQLQALQVAQIEQAKAHQDLRDEFHRWINRGIGLWGACMALYALAQSSIGEALFKIGP